MTAQPLTAERFVRRTQLRQDEYRKNFRQIDSEIIVALTSADADRVTPLMSKIYLRLVSAPAGCWEREGVLRFTGQEIDGRWSTAWEQLVVLAGVASATARKALRWMHEEGVIGYYAGKNGAGIRIFLNRALSSIGRRAQPGQKILRLAPASNDAPRASSADTPFRDSFADSEVLETDLNPRAPKSGAGQREGVKTFSDQLQPPPPHQPHCAETGNRFQSPGPLRVEIQLDELVARLSRELKPSLQFAAERAAAREHERTREWLENKGLPKAARVAQREAFNLLRRHGVADASRTAAGSGVGRGVSTEAAARPLSADEVRELAEACVTMLEVHGQSIDVTLAELSTHAGGMLLPEDAPKVRGLAASMVRGGGAGA